MSGASLTARCIEMLPGNSRPLQHTDDRSDDDIIHSLNQPPPVTSEKNVWAFWDTGFSRMRKWSQRNVIGWIRMLGPDWTVRVLDRVKDSPAHFQNFVDPIHLPECLLSGTMNGPFTGQHSSDMIRLPLLYQHGGIWLDVGIMLFMHLDDVCWTALSSSSPPHEIALASADPSLMSGLAENFFVAARKSNRFIYRWMSIFLEVWKHRTSCVSIHKHPLFRPLVAESNIARFFQLASPDTLDYFGMYLAYERLRLLEDPSDGFSGPAYCQNRVLLIDYREFASAAMQTANSGPKQFTFLSTRYDVDTDTEAFSEARTFCEYMLSQTAMMKLYHWKEEGNQVPTLAELWDREGNEEADREEGTFAQFMRFVSAGYRQERKIDVVRFPRTREKVIVAGVLEVDDDDEDEDQDEEEGDE